MVEAGRRIRERTHVVDELPSTQRTREIAKILMGFKNPDKETVLTPWRVVNMHMVNTIGGYNFFDENFENPLTDGEPPNLVEQPAFGPNKGNVTANVYTGTKDYKDVKILEMNSKSGIYPLYLAYNLYALNNTADDATDSELEFQQALDCWNEALSHVYVLCKTKMAEKITRRTLCGYNKNFKCNTLYIPKLVETMQKSYKDEYGESHTRTEKEVKENYHRLANKIRNVDNWQGSKNKSNTQSLKKETEHMKFNAIVGNPPYQLNIGVEKENYAILIYQYFVELAKEINPDYISFIMPARWYAGGRGLDDFRDKMLHDNRLTVIHDFPDASDVFPGVQIKAGVCYFLWDRETHGDCSVTTYLNGQKTGPIKRPLLEHGNDTFIRYNQAISIVNKVYNQFDKSFSELVSSQTPFGIATSFKGSSQPQSDTDVKMYISGNDKEYKGKAFFAPYDKITKGHEMIQWHKIYISKAGSGSDTFPHQILGKPFYGEPGTVCNQSYLVIGPFKDKTECENAMSYIATKFFRFMVLQKKNSQDAMKGVYQLVPIQDFSKTWTDEMLYSKYGLTDDEISFIDTMIKPMDLSINVN